DFTLKTKDLVYRQDTVQGEQIFIQYGEAFKLEGSATLDHLSTPENLGINGKIDELKVELNAVQKVFANLEIPEELQRYKTLTIKGSASGNVQKLQLEEMTLKVDEALMGNITGEVRNLNDTD